VWATCNKVNPNDKLFNFDMLDALQRHGKEFNPDIMLNFKDTRRNFVTHFYTREHLFITEKFLQMETRMARYLGNSVKVCRKYYNRLFYFNNIEKNI
jgi:hypothetical protein